VRGHHAETTKRAAAVRRVQQLTAVRAEVSEDAERAVAHALEQAHREVAQDSAALIAAPRHVPALTSRA
jgi:hypothetical protein